MGVVLGDFGHRQPVVQILADCDEIEVLHIADAPFPVALSVLRFGREHLIKLWGHRKAQ